jgi:hypothetical protein
MKLHVIKAGNNEICVARMKEKCFETSVFLEIQVDIRNIFNGG